jgi:hypothetical protein
MNMMELRAHMRLTVGLDETGGAVVLRLEDRVVARLDGAELARLVERLKELAEAIACSDRGPSTYADE